MRRFYNFFSAFKEYFALLLCIIVSIIMLALKDTPQISAIRGLTVATIGFAQDMFGFIPNYFSLKEENRILRERNVTLSNEVSLLRESKLENLRLRQILGLKERSSPTYVSTNVVGKSLQLLRNTITIDVGEGDGVRMNMPIVTDAGLVGKVLTTSSHYSIGQLLFNKDFRSSAKVQRSRVDGIVQWEGGDRLQLRNVSRTGDVKEGDVVWTSEYSTIYPAGIKVGIVSRVSQKPGAMFLTVEIAPSVDFARLEEVFVMRHVPDSIRIALEQRISR